MNTVNIYRCTMIAHMYVIVEKFLSIIQYLYSHINFSTVAHILIQGRSKRALEIFNNFFASDDKSVPSSLNTRATKYSYSIVTFYLGGSSEPYSFMSKSAINLSSSNQSLSQLQKQHQGLKQSTVIRES